MISIVSLALVALSMLIVSLYHAMLVYGKGVSTHSVYRSNGGLLSLITPIKNEPVDVVERYGRHFAMYVNIFAIECIVVADYADDTLFNGVLKVFPFNDSVFLVRRFNGVGGRNGAINDGARFSSGDTILLLDVDAYPSEEVLREVAMCSSVCVAKWSVCEPGYTRISRTIAFMTDYGSWLYYKLKSLKGLFIYPLGSGTAIRRRLFEEIGGFRLDVIQDDMWLGTQLMRRRVKPHLVGEMCVGAPQTLSAFLTQQRRWAYGTTDVMKRFGRDILNASVEPVLKFEALFYLLQPLIASTTGLGFILAIPASFSESQRMGLLELVLLSLLGISLALEFLSIKKFAREARGYDPPYVYGRSSAISTLLTIEVLPYVVAAIMGIRIPYKITPKSREKARELSPLIIMLLFTASLIASIIRNNSITLILSAMPLTAALYTLLRL